MKYGIIFFLGAFLDFNMSFGQVAGFTAPDTVCVNTPVTITNTSTGASSYYWNFCVADINTPPIGTNMGNPGGLARPVYIDYVYEGGKYYGFMTNNTPGGLLRLEFGNSLLNVPVTKDLGTVGGAIPNATEGLQIVKNQGKWYIIIVGGNGGSATPSIARIELGTNIANDNPTGHNWGNLGNLAYPHDLYVFEDNGNWYGFTVNTDNNTVTRFNFTSSFANTPTAVNLGNIGNLSGPTGLHAIKDNGNWHLFVTNANNNTLSRLDFGASLLNNPTGQNLGNINGTFITCWDIYIMKFCGEFIAFVINANGKDLVRLNFGGTLLNTPTAVSLGNIGNMNFPHCLSKIFRVGSDLYSFVANVDNNSITRLQFSGCTNINVPNSTAQTPPAIVYKTAGSYNINLTIDDGLPSQSAYCKQIVVLPAPVVTPIQDASICQSTIVTLSANATGATTYSWSPAAGLSATNIYNPVASPATTTQYIVTAGTAKGCTTDDTVVVKVLDPQQCRTAVAAFMAPDTVCVNTPVTLTNNSVGASNYYWNFCVANINTPPTGTNLGNIGGNLAMPVFMDYVLVNGNYYGFSVNHDPGALIRHDFGNSLLNTPTTVNLGNFGGIIPAGIGAEGIQVVENEGKWYAIIVGGWPTTGSTPRVLKIDFGANIANPSPTPTNWGNIGNMLEPIDLHVFKENNNWYGFTVNAENNTITRFNFTNSFDNTPTAANLGNIGNLSYPTGIFAINDNGNWRVFVVNGGNNTTTSGVFSLTRLDFGSSLLNTPTGVNLGNPGNALRHPRDLTIMKFCGQIIGFAVNAHPSFNDIVRFDFNNDLSSIPTATSLGNIGSFAFPHSISKLFRANDDLYCFVTNAHNHTISRLRFAGCTNASVPNSTAQNPPPVIYNTPGTYNINLSVDEGLPSQSSFCKQVVVIGDLAYDFSYKQDLCNPLSIQFFGLGSTLTNPYWSFGDATTATATLSPIHIFSAPGDYLVKFTVQNNGCIDTVRKMISVNVVKADEIITPDTTICYGTTKQLRTKPSLGFCWTPTTWLNDPNLPNPTTSAPQDITYYFTSQTTGNNLILNGDFSNGNTGFTSQYNFANPNMTEGQYFVGASPQAWNGSLSNCGDHTTGTGSMMLINGSPTPDVGVWKQTVTVTPNTNYAFSTWIQALWPPNPAQLKFSINGQDVGNLITASLPTCTWTQFYTTWNSGNNSTATIAIVNKNIQIQGNDFALDDISFAPVIVKRDSVIIQVDTPVVVTNKDTLICMNRPVPINTVGASTYTWSPATGLSNPSIANPIATVETTTQFIVTGTTIHGCTAKDTVLISTFAKPVITKTNDTAICHQVPLQLFAGGGSAYQWLPATTLNDPAVSNPVATPVDNTTYFVHITDGNNCTYKDSVKVDLIPRPQFTASRSQPVCIGSSISLHAAGGDTYLWSPATYLDDNASPDPVSTPDATIQYAVHIAENVCQYDTTIQMTVTVNPVPDVKAEKSNDVDCTMTTAKLNATGASTYAWTPAAALQGDADKPNPITHIDTTTLFKVQGFNRYGCSDTDSVLVKVTNTNLPVFAVPNAFTPNGDGNNDCFGIRRWGRVTIEEFAIFNRWGQKLFATKNPAQCWDGTFNGVQQATGGYVYVITGKSFCGPVKRTGLVMLIR